MSAEQMRNNERMNALGLPYPSPAGNRLDTPGSQAKTDCRNSSPHIGHSDSPQSLPCIHNGHRLYTGAKGILRDDSHKLQIEKTVLILLVLSSV